MGLYMWQELAEVVVWGMVFGGVLLRMTRVMKGISGAGAGPGPGPSLMQCQA